MEVIAEFNFRSTAGFVTDGPGETYVLGTDSYPTVRDSLTFGWVSGPIQSRDRNNSVDPRFAGINFVSNGAADPAVFRFDLPKTGHYAIHLALGDMSSPQTGIKVAVFDTSLPILGFDFLSAISSGQMIDANEVVHSYLDWADNETPVADEFTTTQFMLELGPSSTGTFSSTLAHLKIAFIGPTALPGEPGPRAPKAFYRPLASRSSLDKHSDLVTRESIDMLDAHAYLFDRSNDSRLHSGDKTFTVGGWFRPSDDSSDGLIGRTGLFQDGEGRTHEWKIASRGSDGLVVASVSSDGINYDGSVNKTALANGADTWFLVFLEHNAEDDKLRLWFNGELVATSDFSLGVFNNTPSGAGARFAIGSPGQSDASNSPFYGAVSRCAYWDRALTDDEHLRLYRDRQRYVGLGDALKTDLVEWWELDGRHVFRGLHSGINLGNTGTGSRQIHLRQDTENVYAVNALPRARVHAVPGSLPASKATYLPYWDCHFRVTDPSLQLNDKSVTFGGWFRADDDMGPTTLLGQKSRARLIRRGDENFSIDVHFESGASVSQVLGPSIPDYEWFLIFLEYSLAEHVVRLWINGEQIGSDINPSGAPGLTSDLFYMHIGIAEDVGHMGPVVKCAYWDRILTSDEHAALYADRPAYADLSVAQKADLVSWWQLDTDGWLDSHGSNHLNVQQAGMFITSLGNTEPTYKAQPAAYS